MAISAWWAIALAVPVFVFGELLVRRSRLLSRLNMPASVVGGLCVALIVLAGNVSGAFHAHFQTDVAVMASGHVGFGLGETPNALANMKALVEVFGPAPRAFLVVAVVLNLLIKLVNAANISVFLNFLKP